MNFKKLAGIFAAAAVFSVSVTGLAATGIVTTNGLNIRAGASTSSAVIGSANNSDILKVTGKEDNFYILDYNNDVAYVADDYVKIEPFAVGVCATDLLNIRSNPNTASAVIGKFVYGDEMYLTDEYSEWYEILLRGELAYVHKSYVNQTKTLSTRRAPITASRRGGAGSVRASAKAIELVEYSKNFIGVPYVSGGASPSGFDCSGFTSYVFKQYGVSLPRTASGQAGLGSAVSRKDIQTGDLVFFNTYGGISHVGIALNNNSFIHATVPGDVVKISSLNSSYYSRTYVTARRIFR